MRTMQAQAGLLTVLLLASGIAAASSGCKMFGKDDESTEPAATSEPEPEPEPEETATVDAEDSNAMGDVKTYPNQIPASGMYKLLRDFQVYNEADVSGKRIGGVGRGTLIYLKATLGQWLLIEWPSAPGTMSPGWIQVRTTSNRPDPTMAEEVKEPPDAGVVPTATATADASTKLPPDGGRRLRLPHKIKMK